MLNESFNATITKMYYSNFTHFKYSMGFSPFLSTFSSIEKPFFK